MSGTESSVSLRPSEGISLCNRQVENVINHCCVCVSLHTYLSTVSHTQAPNTIYKAHLSTGKMYDPSILDECTDVVKHGQNFAALVKTFKFSIFD